MASQTRALDVKARAIAMLNVRELEFLRDMLADTDVKGVDEADLETLRDAYKENYDAIWIDGDDDLAADNERHSADDYHTGYEAGAAMVLALLHEVFGIEPPKEEGA